MPSSVDLGKRLEATVKKLISQSRYNSRSEVLREGVRLVQEREQRVAELDAKLEVGLADIRAGRTLPAEEAFADVRKRIRAAVRKRA